MPVLKQQEVFAGRYLLHQLIGEGGFSEVWMAKDHMADDAVVALKVYAPQKGLDEWGLRQFRNEFALTHHLSHPHLLKVHHFDIAEGVPYLVMTYCPDGSLGQALRRKGMFNERQLAQLMYQIGAALSEIHGQEPAIIHQDVKPENILLLQQNTYVLADFGISSRIRHTLTRTSPTPQALSVAYAPPERFDHRPTSSAASDIFSFGVTLYEMCTNTVPWEGAGGLCLLKGARIPTLPLGYSAELNQILQACMSEDPASRPTAADLLQNGKHFLETGQWPATRPEKKKRFYSTAFVASVATATVAFAAVAGIWLHDLEQAPAAAQPVALTSARVEANQPATYESAAGDPATGDPAAWLPESKIMSPDPRKQSSSKKEGQPKKKPSAAATAKPHLTARETPVQQPQPGKTAPPPKEQTAEEWIISPAVEAAFEEQPAVVAAPEQTAESSLPNVQKKETQPATTQSAPAAVKVASAQPKKTVTVPAAREKNNSTEAERPSTSNTSISSAKKSLFDFNKAPDSKKKWRQYKRNYQKRMRKLKKRN